LCGFPILYRIHFAEQDTAEQKLIEADNLLRKILKSQVGRAPQLFGKTLKSALIDQAPDPQ
jgi:hypothetical protein